MHMSEEIDHESWLRRPKTLLAVLVVARLVLETAGAAHTWTRYLSSTVALFLAAIYLGAVAPLRGVTRFTKLILPAIFLTVWTAGWVIFAILVSAILQLHGSHFAAPEDYGNWSHLRQHIIGHVGLIGIYSAVVLVLMAVPFVLRHWPVAVGPAAVLGALVITRYWVEAMGLGSSYASAWSSTVAMLLCGFYLGGVGQCFGLKLSGQLLIPSVLIGWAWRFWVFLFRSCNARGFHRFSDELQARQFSEQPRRRDLLHRHPGLVLLEEALLLEREVIVRHAFVCPPSTSSPDRV